MLAPGCSKWIKNGPMRTNDWLQFSRLGIAAIKYLFLQRKEQVWPGENTNMLSKRLMFWQYTY